MRYLLLGLACLVFLAPAAYACECPEMTEARSLEIIEQAEFIFDGTVMGMEQPEMPEEGFDYANPGLLPENPFFAKLSLKINELYKGERPGVPRLTAYAPVMLDCSDPLQTGDMVLFILNRDEESGELVQAGSCDDPLPAHWDDLHTGRFRNQ